MESVRGFQLSNRVNMAPAPMLALVLSVLEITSSSLLTYNCITRLKLIYRTLFSNGISQPKLYI